MDEVKEKEDKPKEANLVKECPICGEETLIIVSRCATCSFCGWGICG